MMEARKRARFSSKRIESDEIEEILMEEESDEELDELNELIYSPEHVSSTSDETEEVEVRFRVRRPGDSPNVIDFTGPQSGINKTAAPNITTDSSPFSIFILFFLQIFQILLQESNRYFHQYMTTQDTPGPSVLSPDITMEELYRVIPHQVS